MEPRKFLKRAHGQRGQVMVLGALGMILVALMMLITLNLGKATYEKIRIQQVADSAAFSTATMVARAYNFFAYTNRANIAGLVAAASAHGYMSFASSIPGMFRAAGNGFLIGAGIEFALCIATRNPQHCRHGINDIRTWRAYVKKAKELEKNLKDLDKDFVRAINALDAHMRAIAIQQQLLQLDVFQKLMGDKVGREIQKKYSEGSKVLPINGVRNAAAFYSTIESKEKIRKWLGTEISNGTRHKKFVYRRGLDVAYAGIWYDTLLELIQRIPRKYRNGLAVIVQHKGESRTIKGGSGVKSKISNGQHGPDGDASGGADEGRVFIWGGCVDVGIGSYNATIGSGPDSSEHKCNGSSRCCDDVSKHRLKCLGKDGPHNCFTVFKSEKDASKDFGQPKLYVALDSDLRRTQGKGKKIAWEVTDSESGTFSMDVGAVHNKVQQEMGGPGRKVQLSANPNATWGPRGDHSKLGKAVAASKALVYYHHPDWNNNEKGWKEPPNFFNPYWKAKLQPFRNFGELLPVLGSYAGKYAALAAGSVPVP